MLGGCGVDGPPLHRLVQLVSGANLGLSGACRFEVHVWAPRAALGTVGSSIRSRLPATCTSTGWCVGHVRCACVARFVGGASSSISTTNTQDHTCTHISGSSGCVGVLSPMRLAQFLDTRARCCLGRACSTVRRRGRPGLGLAVAQEIAAACGGKCLPDQYVSVKSR